MYAGKKKQKKSAWILHSRQTTINLIQLFSQTGLILQIFYIIYFSHYV